MSEVSERTPYEFAVEKVEYENRSVFNWSTQRSSDTMRGPGSRPSPGGGVDQLNAKEEN